MPNISSQGPSLSLLSYLHSSTLPYQQNSSRPAIPPTPRTPDIMIDITNPTLDPEGKDQPELARANTLEGETEEVDDDDDEDLELAEMGEPGDSNMYIPTDKNSFQLIPSPDPIANPRDRNHSYMDLSVALSLSNLGSGILKLQQSEGNELGSFYFRSTSKSLSNKVSSSDWIGSDETVLGQPYFDRDPCSNLNRLSGSVKYNGKRWSATMSDLLGGKDVSVGSNGLVSFLSPDVRVSGSYGNSISPLGITIATPGASPRTAIAYNHRGFQSPHQSLMAEET